MQVKDDQLWQTQLAELKSDEMGVRFHDFLVAWLSAADREVAGQAGVRLAASKAFDEVEQTIGFLSVEWLGQMLLLLVQHWVYGDELWESLSVWERRMVEQAAVLKIAELQEMAAQSGDADPVPDVTSDTP